MKFGLILALTTVLLAFQNCGKLASTPEMDSDPEQKGQTVIGSTAGYKKISYDSHLQLSVVANPTLEIDLESGTLESTQSGSVKICNLDTDRLEEARSLIAHSSVCEPGPLPPGTLSCLAIAMSDIQLSNGSDSIELRPIACNYGVFLCDGNDAKLRSLIATLVANPPVGCGP